MKNRKKILAFLQNAWSPLYAGGEWPRDSWLKALHRSRSGKRIKVLTDACSHEFYFENTTPIVGGTPDSIIEPDFEHIERIFAEQKPDVAIAFGKQAETAVSKFAGKIPFLVMPHPAYRMLKNELYLEGAKIINEGFRGTKKMAAFTGRKYEL